MRNKQPAKVMIDLGKSNDIGCTILIFVPISVLLVFGMINSIRRGESDWVMLVGVLLILGIILLLIYWYFFMKRQLIIDGESITGPFMLSLAIQDVAAIEEVTYAMHPHTIVLHTLHDRAFMVESPSKKAVDQLIQAILDHEVPMRETLVKPGTSVYLSTRRPVATSIGSNVVPLPVPENTLSVSRFWKRTDHEVDVLIQQEQQLGHTEYSADQTLRLVIPPEEKISK